VREIAYANLPEAIICTYSLIRIKGDLFVVFLLYYTSRVKIRRDWNIALGHIYAPEKKMIVN
jgi:hypothetical protein